MKPAAPLWLALTLLGSGCARTVYAPAPVALPDCPAPERPALPPYDPALPFDAPENLDVALWRDILLKRYAEQLESSLACYTGETTHAPD